MQKRIILNPDVHIPATSSFINFVGGLGRTLDLGGALNGCDDDLMEIYQDLRARRQAAPVGPEADADAIAGDWNAVGRLFYHAMGHIAEETNRT